MTAHHPLNPRAFPGIFTAALVCAGLAAALLGGCGGGDTAATPVAPPAAALTAPIPPVTPVAGDRAQLGQRIFTDASLSEPRGTACAACHQANQGFAGNNGGLLGVSVGSTRAAVGLRNAMTNRYTGFVPPFEFFTENGKTEAKGGHFWDGRAETLATQALGPFLNPLEMNNPNAKAVVDKVAASAYALLFRQEFGANIFSDTNAAFTQIGVAIEAFERSAAMQPFSSKYDAMVRGQAQLAPAESRGMALFMDPSRANCAGCHLMNPASGKPEDSLFSEFSYYATGVPRNNAIPKNADPTFFDLGLCGPDRTPPLIPASLRPTVAIESFCGMFRMPTLRNVAERPAFMHNGVFKDLRDVVRFYSTRNSDPQRLYGPSGIANDLPSAYLANIEKAKAPFNRPVGAGAVLSEAEIVDVVAFMRTLSDGFTPP